MSHLIDIKNQRFGSAVAKELLPARTASGDAEWKCLCDCGNWFRMSGARLRSGEVTNCGCRGRKGYHVRPTRQLDTAPDESPERKVRKPPRVASAAVIQDFICHHKATGDMP